jgi:hypothetical protein
MKLLEKLPLQGNSSLKMGNFSADIMLGAAI